MTTQSEKGKIVYLFSFMTMVFVVLCVLSIQQLRNSNHLRVLDETIEAEHATALRIFNADVDFFGYELNNAEFFRTGKSAYLQRHDSLIHEMGLLFGGTSKVENLDTTFEAFLLRYDSTFREIVRQVQARGYKDFGLEGKMRAFAHELENNDLISKVEILSLRRYEKDYLLGFENAYVVKFDSLMSIVKGRNKASHTLEVLTNYSQSFHDLVKISDSIGLEKQENLKGRLNSLTRQLVTAIENLDHTADVDTLHAYDKGLTFFSIGVIFAAILCIGSVILIARKL